MILNEMFYAFLWILTVVWRVCLAEIAFSCNSIPFERSQNPGNITCVFYYSESTNYTLTCHWIPKKEKHTETTYMLTRRDSRGKNKSSCFSKNGSCSLYDVPYALHSYVELKAENEKEVVNCVRIKPEEILKPDPPQITEVKPIAGMKQMLRVSWKRPRKIPKRSDLKCQIHYTAATKNHTEDVIISDREEYNLTNLWDFTYYTVVLRCTLSVSKVWSEWSIEKMGRTEEQAPLRVDLWRVIEFDQHTENRVVHLLWKECKIFPCSGLVNGYRIKYFTKSNDSLKYTKNTSDNSATLNLTKEAYIISVTAFNEAGESPEATLRIPPILEEEVMDHERIVSIKASALEEQMFLEWEPSNVEINNYIVEWYYESNSIKRSWQKITNTTKWISPKGAFIRFKYYYISVYPLYKDEIKTPCSIRTYFHQGIPAEGPTAEEVEDIDKNHATIKWKAVPEAKRNGFITNYTVFYKAEDGKEFGETVDFSVLQYRLKLLQANTKYTAHVMASTIAGGKNGTATTFITSKLSVVDIVLINVTVGMFMLCLLIIAILGAVKRHMLKDALWPKIPHPHIMATIVTMDQQPVPLRKSPSADETHIIISEVQPCSKDQNEFEFPNSEDCLSETDDATEVMVGSKDTLWHEEAHPPTFYPEHDFRNPTLPDMKGNCYDNQEVQDQPYLKEFNPYLKNSVPTREFILSENLVHNTEGTNTQPVLMTSCLPNSIEQPYVALDTFTLLPKH